MIHTYKTKIVNMINRFEESQLNVLETVSKSIVDHMELDGKFFVIGTGHSHMIGEEFYARAGGLACIQLIAPMELTLGEHPLKSTNIERIAEYANVIISQYNINTNDIVMITSNSGRNAMPVELALELKRMGIKTIAFTNLNHSKEVTSRHSSGKKLYEVCDYVIDNCGCVGDAFMDVEGVRGKMGASSSIIGMFMAQSLSMLIAKELADRGMEVPVFLSANVDDGDSWNDSIMKKYYGI